MTEVDLKAKVIISGDSRLLGIDLIGDTLEGEEVLRHMLEGNVRGVRMGERSPFTLKVAGQSKGCLEVCLER